MIDWVIVIVDMENYVVVQVEQLNDFEDYFVNSVNYVNSVRKGKTAIVTASRNGIVPTEDNVIFERGSHISLLFNSVFSGSLIDSLDYALLNLVNFCLLLESYKLRVNLDLNEKSIGNRITSPYSSNDFKDDFSSHRKEIIFHLVIVQGDCRDYRTDLSSGFILIGGLSNSIVFGEGDLPSSGDNSTDL